MKNRFDAIEKISNSFIRLLHSTEIETTKKEKAKKSRNDINPKISVNTPKNSKFRKTDTTNEIIENHGNDNSLISAERTHSYASLILGLRGLGLKIKNEYYDSYHKNDDSNNKNDSSNYSDNNNNNNDNDDITALVLQDRDIDNKSENQINHINNIIPSGVNNEKEKEIGQNALSSSLESCSIRIKNAIFYSEKKKENKSEKMVSNINENLKRSCLVKAENCDQVTDRCNQKNLDKDRKSVV